MIIVSWIRQLLCGITGHRDQTRHFANGRICLRCVCGKESPGWQIRPIRPTA